ncbi:hypothetical protein JRG66_00645 [Salinimicrobium tongyeongense]|uniref:Anti-sigma factor n=1 Tax=Salinimicrobium tongyeongense TaxID=2809707 RepID=A0ABY6NR99_9FLAO|nr:hypothetical protein [Salinimicrobium tongyeongense]UZH55445.1 hypothetical protein JRG66_00645 [Salinimicrobium tongyeongense]
MAQDIRKMLQEDKSLLSKPPKGHLNRFEARLEAQFPQEKKESSSPNRSFYFLKIAAVLVVALGIGFFFLNKHETFSGNEITNAPEVIEQEKEEEISVTKEYQLSDESPEFRKIENFYLASLNIELAKLEVNDSNKALVDSFMKQLAGLDQEYKKLNAEISETGLTESSVEALISNLQLRLELLYKLKNKIKDINQSKMQKNENHKA